MKEERNTAREKKEKEKCKGRKVKRRRRERELRNERERNRMVKSQARVNGQDRSKTGKKEEKAIKENGLKPI
jgi:hypothetical protein